MKNGLHQGLLSFMYAEGSLQPVSRRLSQGGHPCHSGIQVGGCGEGIVRERQNGDTGVFSPRPQCVLPFAPWAVVTLPDQCPSHHPAALCPWELGLCLSCHNPLPPHVMWGREQHLYCGHSSSSVPGLLQSIRQS